jgi:hypothetical protein
MVGVECDLWKLDVRMEERNGGQLSREGFVWKPSLYKNCNVTELVKTNDWAYLERGLFNIENML